MLSQAEMLSELSSVLSQARNEQELQVFLEGLLTPREIEEITFRWRLMLRLMRGQPQREIGHELGVSLGKIARGSRLLKYGPPEFRQLLERVLEQQQKDRGQ
jgi:TrpR family trp operon transcriptional repressor